MGVPRRLGDHAGKCKKMIFSIKVFVTLLDYLKIPQVAVLGDLDV
jgi:hypothetical protein